VSFKARRIILGILLLIIAINALGGGYYGMAGAENVPLEWLEGSPFKSYFLPSLFLFIVIGGFCLAGSILVFRNSIYAKRISLCCVAILISWILIQVATIGHVSWMQPAILILAIIIFLISIGIYSDARKV
jgi:hypothetical protein